MLIPIKCFNCGMVIGNKYNKYLELKEEEEEETNKNIKEKKTNIFEKLRLKRYCCRRMLLSHVDYLTRLK